MEMKWDWNDDRQKWEWKRETSGLVLPRWLVFAGGCCAVAAGPVGYALALDGVVRWLCFAFEFAGIGSILRAVCWGPEWQFSNEADGGPD
jgi:hypothetical protein